jgi:hypothetical protein
VIRWWRGRGPGWVRAAHCRRDGGCYIIDDRDVDVDKDYIDDSGLLVDSDSAVVAR